MNSYGPAFLLILVGCVVAFLIYANYSENKKFGRYVQRDGPVDYCYMQGGMKPCGIAISRTRKTVYLRKGNLHRSYGFNDVRSWEINDVQGGRMVGVGIVAGMAAMGENMRAQSNAAAISGLFVAVRDIDAPELQIQMERNDQKRWFEILNQLINDK